MHISRIESASLAIGLLVLLTASGILPSGTSAQEVQRVRWLIAHEPASVFDNAIKTFSEVLAKESGRTIELEVLTRSDLGYESDVPVSDILRHLDSGDIELSSALVTGLANYDPLLSSIEFPYLFPNYDALFTALDGDAGAHLLHHMSETLPVRGLAFTLSGGFRIVLADRKLEKADDFEALSLSASGPVSEKIFAVLGAVQDETGANGVETTYSRIAGSSSIPLYPYANETNHNVLLTALIVSDRFFDSLTAPQRAALEKAAQAAAKVEREDSVALAEKTRMFLAEKGITLVSVQQETLREALAGFTFPNADTELTEKLYSY